MIAAGAFLAVLDAVILSAEPDLTRTAFALVVTMAVGWVIVATWRSNTRIEKAAADTKKNAR